MKYIVLLISLVVGMLFCGCSDDASITKPEEKNIDIELSDYILFDEFQAYVDSAKATYKYFDVEAFKSSLEDYINAHFFTQTAKSFEYEYDENGIPIFASISFPAYGKFGDDVYKYKFFIENGAVAAASQSLNDYENIYFFSYGSSGAILEINYGSTRSNFNLIGSQLIEVEYLNNDISHLRWLSFNEDVIDTNRLVAMNRSSDGSLESIVKYSSMDTSRIQYYEDGLVVKWNFLHLEYESVLTYDGGLLDQIVGDSTLVKSRFEDNLYIQDRYVIVNDSSFLIEESHFSYNMIGVNYILYFYDDEYQNIEYTLVAELDKEGLNYFIEVVATVKKVSVYTGSISDDNYKGYITETDAYDSDGNIIDSDLAETKAWVYFANSKTPEWYFQDKK